MSPLPLGLPDPFTPRRLTPAEARVLGCPQSYLLSSDGHLPYLVRKVRGGAPVTVEIPVHRLDRLMDLWAGHSSVNAPGPTPKGI